jgi:predicted transcriptional regulator
MRLTATERAKLERLAKAQRRSLGYIAREGIRQLEEHREEVVVVRPSR